MGTVIKIDRWVDKPKKTRGSITRKLGSIKLYVDFYYYGERIVRSTGLDDTPENEQKAREFLNRVFEKIDNNSFVFAEAFPGASADKKAFYAQREGWDYKPDPQDVLFSDYAEKWSKRFIPKFKSKTKQDLYEEILGYWLIPYLGNMTFYQINGVAIKEFADKLVRRKGKNAGQELSPSRIRNILIPLRRIWKDACEEYRWILPNPIEYAKGDLPERRPRRPKVFRFHEWIKLIENLDSFYRPIAEIMIMTGMIASEIAGLRREDIGENHITIQNSIVKKHEKANLKTKYRERTFPLTSAMRERLETVLSRSKGKYVFSMKSGRIWDGDYFRKRPWANAFKSAEIDYRVPYVMRHSFAAWALTLRMDPIKLVDRMGHSSKKMVYDVYGSYVEGLEKDARQIIEYFGNDFLGLNEKTTPTFTV